MEIKEVTYFIALAEERKIVTAAERLYISQPALSQYLKQLEQRLDTTLFERTSSGLTLTEAGMIYLNACYHMQHISQLIDEIR